MVGAQVQNDVFDSYADVWRVGRLEFLEFEAVRGLKIAFGAPVEAFNFGVKFLCWLDFKVVK